MANQSTLLLFLALNDDLHVHNLFCMWLHVMHLYITEDFKWFEMKIKNQTLTSD